MSDDQSHAAARTILLQMGEFFQIQVRYQAVLLCVTMVTYRMTILIAMATQQSLVR